MLRLYISEEERSLWRFDLVAVKDLPVAKGKNIKSFKIMGVPYP